MIFRKKKTIEDIDKKKKEKVIELYTKKTPMIEIKRKTGVSTDNIREIIENYLQDEAEMNALDVQIKEKFRKKQLVAEPPYLVMKIIREKDKKGKWQRRKVYTQQLLNEPSSEAEFMDFVMLYGDGTYSVLDKNKRLIKHIEVDNVAGFRDPSEIEEEEEEEEEEGSDYNPYPYPHQQPYPPSQHKPPKGKGKKHDFLTQQAHQALQQQDYHLNLKRRMAEIAMEQGKIELADKLLKDVEKLEQQSGLAPEEREAYESIEKEDYTINKKRKIADILMKRGETERANKILDEITKMENEKSLSFDEKEAEKGMESERRIDNILLKMAERYNAQGNAKAADKIMKRLGIIDDKGDVTTTGYEKLREIVELQKEFGNVATELGWNKGAEEKSKAQEMANVVDLLMKSGKENIIEPIKEYLTGENEIDEDIIQELYPQNEPQRAIPPQQDIHKEEIRGIIIPQPPPTQPPTQPPIQPQYYQKQKQEDIYVDEEELKKASDYNEPISEEELNQSANEELRPVGITKLTREHRYMISKVFPIYKTCILEDIDPVAVAEQHFNLMTVLPGKLFVGKSKLIKAHRASRLGYDFFINEWKPFEDKMEKRYGESAKYLIEKGETVFRNNFNPPPGVSMNRAIILINQYIKFKLFWQVFISDKGRMWLEIYQKKMFDLLDYYLKQKYPKPILDETFEEVKEVKEEKLLELFPMSDKSNEIIDIEPSEISEEQIIETERRATALASLNNVEKATSSPLELDEESDALNYDQDEEERGDIIENIQMLTPTEPFKEERGDIIEDAQMLTPTEPFKEEEEEEKIITEMLDHDIIVSMPPIKESTLRVKVKSTEKATPHIIEPEEKGIPIMTKKEEKRALKEEKRKEKLDKRKGKKKSIMKKKEKEEEDE